MRRFASLRRRADFTRLRQRGRRTTTETLTIYRSDAGSDDAASLVGIAVSASIGKAVVRNTIRRRVLAILDDVLRGHRPVRLLFVARPAAAAAPFARLNDDVRAALGAR